MTLHPLLVLTLGLVMIGTGAGMTTRLALVDERTPGVPPGTPTQAQVSAAQQAARGAANDVASVRAALVVAGQRLESAQVEAARAGEAFNGARYRATLARQAARVANRRAARAAGDVGRQRAAYADTVSASLQMAPELTALSALTEADGIDRVVEELTTLQTTTEAMDREYDAYRATDVLASVARQDADRARLAAGQARADARLARDDARRAAAAAVAGSAAAERDRLIGRLATLQHVSTAVARQRQHGLEVQAARAAALAAQQAAEQAAQEAAEQAAQEAAEQAAEQAAAEASASASAEASPTAEPTGEPTTEPTSETTREPSSTDSATTAPPAEPTAEPTIESTAEPTSDPTSPAPSPSAGAAAAIAFARDQIGEPYVYGAAGPGSWDCSGLTMGAWDAGGISLPHYSVAQYEQSTPISVGDLRPGDLVFWGSSGSPGSIYHVALYTGDGMIIQAPRTGRTVYEGSMYDWRTPDFFARP